MGTACAQNPGEFPIFQAGATNSYAPLVDTTIIDHVSWVAPQMYNDGIPFEGDAVKYIQSLQASSKLDWDGTEIEVKIPPSKIVLGYPSTQAAAPVHALPEWETPEGLLALYRSSPELMATRGVMTWSTGHDYSSGWKWINVSDHHSNPETRLPCIECTHQPIPSFPLSGGEADLGGAVSDPQGGLARHCTM